MIKNCIYCQVPFYANTNNKYCPNHKNKICNNCNGIIDGKSRNLCSKCERERGKDYVRKMKEKDPNWKRTFCKEKKRKDRKEYVKRHPEKIKEYYQKTKAEVSIKSAEYYLANKNDILSRNKKWQEENKEKFYLLQKRGVDKFRGNNPHIVAWRNMLHRTLKYFGIKKNKKTLELCGYSSGQLRDYIESKFTEGMSWNNYGKWHIDHIKPVTKFEKDTPVSVVNALSNLQPLWKIENLRKKNKF